MSIWDDYQILSEAEYTGEVLVSLDGCLDEYFPSIEAYKKEVISLLLDGELEQKDLPDYIWGCKTCELYKFDADEIAFNSLDDSNIGEEIIVSEGKFDRAALKKLQAALDEFYLESRHIKLLTFDHNIKIKLDWGEALQGEAHP